MVDIYEKCGGMTHAQNPFASEKPVKEIYEYFPTWLEKIQRLLAHHHIELVGGEIMLVALMNRADNGLPQAVIFKRMD